VRGPVGGTLKRSAYPCPAAPVRSPPSRNPQRSHGRITEIKVEVVPQEAPGEELGPGRVRPDFAGRVNELGDALNDVAAALRERLHELSVRESGWDLDQVTLAFSLDLQAEAGVIVARASSRAGFQATLTWTRSEP
jgi:hypothetical protein